MKYIIIALMGVLIVSVWLFLSFSGQKKSLDAQQTNLVFNSNLKIEQVICTDSRTIICGTEYADRADFRTANTVIKSVESTEINIKVPGVFSAACYTGNTLFFVTKNYKVKQNPKNSFHKLFKVSQEDGKAEKIHDWENGNSYIHSILFETPKSGFAFYRPSGNPLDYQLLKTDDGGEGWKTVNFKRPIVKTQSNNVSLFILSYKRNDKADWIYSINKEDGEMDSIQFDLNITDFSVGENGEYWLLGKDGDRTILQHYEKGKITDINTFSEDAEFFPKQLHKYNDVMVVLASRIDKSMFGGFGGTEPAMYFSKNNGLKWENQELDGALYLKPVSFYKDERMMAYVGHGKMLTYNLKEP